MQAGGRGPQHRWLKMIPTFTLMILTVHMGGGGLEENLFWPKFLFRHLWHQHLFSPKNKGAGTEAHFSNRPPSFLHRASLPPPPPHIPEQFSGCLMG